MRAFGMMGPFFAFLILMDCKPENITKESFSSSERDFVSGCILWQYQQNRYPARMSFVFSKNQLTVQIQIYKEETCTNLRYAYVLGGSFTESDRESPIPTAIIQKVAVEFYSFAFYSQDDFDRYNQSICGAEAVIGQLQSIIEKTCSLPLLGESSTIPNQLYIVYQDQNNGRYIAMDFFASSPSPDWLKAEDQPILFEG